LDRLLRLVRIAVRVSIARMTGWLMVAAGLLLFYWGLPGMFGIDHTWGKYVTGAVVAAAGCLVLAAILGRLTGPRDLGIEVALVFVCLPSALFSAILAIAIITGTDQTPRVALAALVVIPAVLALLNQAVFVRRASVNWRSRLEDQR
jgi:hypothetical protein